MPKTATPKIALRATAGKKTLNFGMVNVGVSLAPALDDSGRLSARQLDPILRTPLKQQLVNENGEIIERVDVVKGYPYGDGFVTLESEEVPKALGDDVISLVANIPLSELPAEWLEKTYLAWPTDVTHNDGYALLAGYLKANDRAFIGTTVAAGTTKAFALRWSVTYGCLVAQLLSFHANVRWESVETVCKAVAALSEPDERMQAMAETVFGNLPDEYDWTSVTDEYGERLAQAISEKALAPPMAALRGVLTPSEVVPKGKTPPDLLAALQASLSEMPVAASTSTNPKVTA